MLFSSRLFSQMPVEHGDYFRSVAGSLRSEGSGAGPFGDLVRYRPEHGLIVVLALFNVAERILDAVDSLAVIPVEEGDDLSSGHGPFRSEGGGSGAVGDAVLICPEHRVMIIRVGGNIGEGHVSADLGAAGRSVKEGDDLSPGAGDQGAEVMLAGTVGDALLESPVYGVMVVGILGDVVELFCFRGGRAAAGAAAGAAHPASADIAITVDRTTGITFFFMVSS